MKRFLMTSGLAATLLATSALYYLSNAQAQDNNANAVSVSPVTGWAVSRVGDVVNGDGYCALARRFSGSQVVTIAQNKNGEASLAFDFQRDLFSINSSYDVTIATGGQIARYDIIADAATGLVVKLGANSRLLQELERTQMLSLSVDGNQYNFQFTDFASGRDQQQTCLGVKEQVVRAEVERQMGSQVNMMRDELTQLQAENRQLLSKLENERRRFSQQVQAQQGGNSQINELVNELRAAEQSNTQLMAQLQEERTTSTTLKNRVAALMSRGGEAAASSSEAAMTASVQAAQEERAELMAMLNAERQRREEIEAIVAQKSNIDGQKAELVSRIAELERVNSSLAMTLDRQKALSESLQSGEPGGTVQAQQVRTLLNENAELRERVALLSQNKIGEDQSLLDAARKSLFETRAQYERLNIEKENLERQLQQERQQFSQSAGVGDGQGASQALARQLSEVSEENRRLRDALQDKSMQTPATSALMDRELDEKLALQNKDVNAAQREIDNLEKMLEAERNERMSLARTMADMNKQGTDNKDMSMIERVYEDRLKRLEAENQALRNTMSAGAPMPVANSVSAQDLQAARVQIAQKAQQLEMVSSERDELKALLEEERARRNATLDMLNKKTNLTQEQSELNAQLRQLEARNLELSRALDAARTKQEQSASGMAVAEVRTIPPSLDGNGEHDVRTQLDIALAERDEYRNLLQKERTRLRDVQSLRSRIGNVQDDQENLNDTIRSLQNERVDLLRQLEYERARLDSLPEGDPRKTAQPKMVSDPSVLAELEMTKAERDRLQQRVQAMSSGSTEQMDLLQRMLDDAQKAETQMARRVSALEQERQQLNSLLKEAQRGATEARKDVDQFASARANITGSNLEAADNDQDRLLALEEENRRLYSEIQGLQSKKTEIDGIDAELVSVQAQNDILRKELAEYKGKSASVVADEDMVAHLRGTIDRLSLQNENLQEALELSREREVQKADDNQYRQQLMNAQTRIQAVMVENASLSRELEQTRQQAEGVLMTSQNEDLDLARASVRYKEAEREIDRLSSILREERAKHAAEVSELEDKLFDPAITEQEQIRKLDALRAEIRRLGGTVPQSTMSSALSPLPAEDRVAFVPEQTAVAPTIDNQAASKPYSQELADEALRLLGSDDQPAARTSAERLRARVSQRPDIDGQPSRSVMRRSSEANTVDFVSNGDNAAVLPDIPSEPVAMPAAASHDDVVALNINPSRMTPIMDGPGEASLSEAVQRGGGVYVMNERQVVQATPEMPSQNVVSPANVQTASVAPTNLGGPAAVQMAPVMQQRGPNGQDIASLLVDAGVPMVSGFEKVDSVSSDQFSAFRWDTGSVYGSAEKTTMASPTAFSNAIEGYLRKTEARCAGSFDRTLSSEQSSERKNVMSYDIACVGNDMQGAGAAVIFYVRDNTFNVIAHEAGLEEFSQAMSTRDQIANILIR